jgi:hypothetical protein
MVLIEAKPSMYRQLSQVRETTGQDSEHDDAVLPQISVAPSVC